MSENIRFSERVHSLRKQGTSDEDIAKELGIPDIFTLRRLYREDKEAIRRERTRDIKRMFDKGMHAPAIADRMGLSEATVLHYAGRI